jgi:2-iminoacetate synthase ThiH
MIYYQLSEEQLKSLINEAAEEGARRALHSVGLHDEKSADDVKDLRNLLKSYRTAKRVVGEQMLRVVTTAILAALVAGLAIKMKLHGGN